MTAVKSTEKIIHKINVECGKKEGTSCTCTWASRWWCPTRTFFKTREFLERAEQEGRVVSVCDDLPRSFVLVGGEEGPPTVYISQLSPSALLRRTESNWFE